MTDKEASIQEASPWLVLTKKAGTIKMNARNYRISGFHRKNVRIR